MTSPKSGKSAKKSSKKAASKRKPAPPARPDEMSPEVIEFIQAVDRYKRLNDRKFPNLSEILQIVKELGYEKSTA